MTAALCMIASLTGIIKYIIKNSVIVEVNNIGYRVQIPILYLNELKIGEKIIFYTHLQVREDAHVLFGFRTLKELNFFELLLTVSDVGPKSALGVLSLGTVDDIEGAIARQDLTFLTSVAGIGKKTSERIILGLKDKIADKAFTDLSIQSGDTGEIFDALEQMGYKANEIRDVLKLIQGDKGTIEEKLKKALKMIGKNK